MKLLLIIVSGPPGIGKTTLARKIGIKYRLPVLIRDGLKEALFDALGYADREWSKKMGVASYRTLDIVLEALLEARQSMIVESNFKPNFDNERFQRLQEKYQYHSIQILCSAEPEKVIQRFRSRVENGGRHPGHDDINNLEEHARAIREWNHDPLQIQGDVVRIEMDDFDSIDHDSIFRAIGKHLSA